MTRTPTKSASAEREAFATRLKALRQSYGIDIGEPGLTQEEFAKRLGLQGETYRRYERGETEPPLRVLAAIRRLTGINLNSLIAGEIDRAA
jgi:transcriptional regulator with XRE-family HTH domain